MHVRQGEAAREPAVVCAAILSIVQGDAARLSTTARRAAPAAALGCPGVGARVPWPAPPATPSPSAPGSRGKGLGSGPVVRVRLGLGSGQN
eukprot:scaffold94567_cov69-Phaeocystis_antarctica.AAC.1